MSLATRTIPVAVDEPVQLNLSLMWDQPIDLPMVQAPDPEPGEMAMEVAA